MRSGRPFAVTTRLTLLVVLAAAMTSLPFRAVWVAAALANAVRSHSPGHSPHAQVIHRLTTMVVARRVLFDRQNRMVAATDRVAAQPAPHSGFTSRSTHHLSLSRGRSSQRTLIPLRC